MYLSEILSKLQTCEVTDFMTFSDVLLIYDFFYINNTYCKQQKVNHLVIIF